MGEIKSFAINHDTGISGRASWILRTADMKKKVMIGLSGGVDSAVAASLLKDRGYEVVGVTMCLGVAPSPGSKIKCCGPEEIEDAKRVCRTIGIRHYILDFAHELEEDVIEPFVRDYRLGITPNPCVVCNRRIKFGALLDKALAMGFDFLATGHYAGITEIKSGPALIKAKDRRKDQTYFLYAIEQKVLKNVIFPLADLTKDEVRKIAIEKNLPVSNKPESQDICFIPAGGMNAFMKGRFNHEPGDIVDAGGRKIGRHKGIASYTVGQRTGLGISSPMPLRVISIDAGRNQIVAGERKYLFARGLVADNINIFSKDLPERLSGKIRYAHKSAACHAEITGGELVVTFEEPQESITPGQSIVIYDGETVLGGGIIRYATHRTEELHKAD
jgi:tRNA-uridine 2-sulfurtransferase